MMKTRIQLVPKLKQGLKLLWAGFRLTIFFFIINPAMAGQALTGKILIDGVVYSDGNSQTTKGSGIKGTQSRQVGSFDNLTIKGAVDVHYQHSQQISAVVTGDGNLLALVDLQNSNGTLTIDTTGSYQTHLPLVVELSGANLKVVKMKGAGDAYFKDLQASSLKLVLDGSGDVQVNGAAEQFIVTLNGSGDVDAKDLLSNQVEAAIRGSGNIDVRVKQSIAATITGSGDVNYYGSPTQVEKKVIGSGEIRAGD